MMCPIGHVSIQHVDDTTAWEHAESGEALLCLDCHRLYAEVQQRLAQNPRVRLSGTNYLHNLLFFHFQCPVAGHTWAVQHTCIHAHIECPHCGREAQTHAQPTKPMPHGPGFSFQTWTFTPGAAWTLHQAGPRQEGTHTGAGIPFIFSPHAHPFASSGQAFRFSLPMFPGPGSHATTGLKPPPHETIPDAKAQPAFLTMSVTDSAAQLAAAKWILSHRNQPALSMCLTQDELKSAAAVKKRYHRLSLFVHPDKALAIADATAAYQALHDSYKTVSETASS